MDIFQPPIIVSLSGEPYYQQAGYNTSRQYRADYREVPSPCISFICDDGNETDLTVMYPVFAAAEKKFCIAVTVNYIGEDTQLTLDELNTLKDSGLVEFMAHGMDHLTMDGVTDETVLSTQIKEAKESLIALGFDIESYVAPYHGTSELARKWVAQNYRCGTSNTWSYKTNSGGSIAGCNVPSINTFALCRVDITGTTQDDIDGYEAAIDDAVAKDGWVIFYMHDAVAANATIVGDLLTYAASAGVDVLSVSEALDRFENVYQSGDLEELNGWAAGIDGSLRAPSLDVVEIRVGNPAYPWGANYATIGYTAGNLRLKPVDSGEEIIFGDALGIRPETNGDQTCGRDGWSWKSVSTYELYREGAFADRCLNDKVINSSAYASAGATFTKTFTVGEGSKILGIGLRPAGLGGPSTFDAAFTGGVSQSICSGESTTTNEVTAVIFDDNASSPIVSGSGDVTVTFTANTTNWDGEGRLYCSLWYQKMETP